MSGTLADWGRRGPLSGAGTPDRGSSSQCEALGAVEAAVGLVPERCRGWGAVQAAVSRTLQRLARDC